MYLSYITSCLELEHADRDSGGRLYIEEEVLDRARIVLRAYERGRRS
jgi:hypothetical protein